MKRPSTNPVLIVQNFERLGSHSNLDIDLAIDNRTERCLKHDMFYSVLPGYIDALNTIQSLQCIKSKLSQLRLPHPIRLNQKSPLTPLTPYNSLILPSHLLPNNALHTPAHPLIPSINLQPPNMRILSILMILDNLNLDQKRPQRLPISATTNMFEWYIDPAFRLREFQRGEGDQVVVAGPGEESDLGGRVRLVGFEVEEYAD